MYSIQNTFRNEDKNKDKHADQQINGKPYGTRKLGQKL